MDDRLGFLVAMHICIDIMVCICVWKSGFLVNVWFYDHCLFFFLRCVSFKKPNNAQGAQSRVSGVGVNPDASYASAARTLQNGTHLQPSAQGMESKLTSACWCSNNIFW